jgi:hypothetical protein
MAVLNGSPGGPSPGMEWSDLTLILSWITSANLGAKVQRTVTEVPFAAVLEWPHVDYSVSGPQFGLPRTP